MKKHQTEEEPFSYLQLINHFSRSQNLFCKNIPKNTLNRFSVPCAKRILAGRLERGTFQFVLKS